MRGLSISDGLPVLSAAFQEAALGQTTWGNALGALAAATGAKSGELIGLGSAPFQIITEVSPEEMLTFTAARGHDPLVNSRVRVGMRAPTMALLDESDFDTEGDIRRSRDYGEVIGGLDIPFAHLTILQRSSDVTLGLTLLRTARAGAMPDEQKRLLEAASPHVLAAIRLHMAAEGRALDLTLAGFQLAEKAAFVIDRTGRARGWTPSGDELLRAGDLRLKEGRLTVRDANDRRLDVAIERARRVRDVSDLAPEAVLTRDSEGLAYPIEVMALPARHGFDFEAGAIVIARPPRDKLRRTARIAGLAFGLTKAEAAVASLLVSGATAAEIAERQEISVGTVRTHIRRLFEKTGSRSQIALIAMITRLI